MHGAAPTIREAAKSDLGWLIGAVMRLNANGTEADPRFRFVPDVDQRLREVFGHAWFGRFQPFPGCWVAEAAGERIGMVSGEVVVDAGLLARPPTARIDNLWVEPAHRRAGVARALVEAFRARAVRAGFPALEVSTLHRDTRAVAFWRAIGLTEQRVVLVGDESREADGNTALRPSASAGEPRVKQVLVVRKDLGMRKGKMIAQGAHASLASVLGVCTREVAPDGSLVLRVPPELAPWVDGSAAKIAVGVPDEASLVDVHRRALAAHLPCALIRDLGRTEFHGVPTLTACAVGPAPAEAVDAITGELTLL